MSCAGSSIGSQRRVVLGGLLWIPLVQGILLGLFGLEAVAGDHPKALRAKVAKAGQWRSLPEPGEKAKSGVKASFQFAPETPVAGKELRITLRFDEIVGRDSKVDLKLGRLQWARGQRIRSQWRLPPGKVTEVSFRVIPAQGDGFVHLFTRQKGRRSVRSILVSTGGVSPRTELRVGQSYEIDARGEPIVRMRSAPAPVGAPSRGVQSNAP